MSAISYLLSAFGWVGDCFSRGISYINCKNRSLTYKSRLEWFHATGTTDSLRSLRGICYQRSAIGWVGFVVIAGLVPTQSYIFACKTACYDHIKGISPGLFAIIRNTYALDKFQIFLRELEN